MFTLKKQMNVTSATINGLIFLIVNVVFLDPVQFFFFNNLFFR